MSINDSRYDSCVAARLDLVDWIEGFHDQRRIHPSIGFRALVDAGGSLKRTWCSVRTTRAR